MTLKSYQRDSLVSVQSFWSRILGRKSASDAFAEVAKENGLPAAYHVHPHLRDVPNVCIKIPTGGGKTYVAAAACGIAMQTVMQAGMTTTHPTILWLVPGSEIESQTIATLRDPRHQNNVALRTGAGMSLGVGAARVMSLDEALQTPSHEYDAQAVVIVATIQSFRRKNANNLRANTRNPILDGPLIGFVAAKRPLVIVDEAHNTRSDLSAETLIKFNPSAVLEITATPQTGATTDNPSNIVYAASPLDVHREQMIRLPITAAALPDPETAIQWALAKRDHLERMAATSPDHGMAIRPILVIQAENSGGGKPWDHDRVKDFVMTVCKVPEESIAVQTGGTRDLDGTDLLAPTCKIRCIITKSALKEGWDCPWAYVLCTLRAHLSEGDTQQIIGRVLRQYQAVRCSVEDLNQAWVTTSNTSITAVLSELRDVLVTDLGFTQEDVKRLTRSVHTGGGGGQQVVPYDLDRPVVFPDIVPDRKLADAAMKDPEVAGSVSFDYAKNTLTATKPLSDHAIQVIATSVPAAVRGGLIAGLRTLSARVPASSEPLVAVDVAERLKAPLVFPVDENGIQGQIGDCFVPNEYEPSPDIVPPFKATAPHAALGTVTVGSHGEAVSALGADTALDGSVLLGDLRARLTEFLRGEVQQKAERDLSGFVLGVVARLIDVDKQQGAMLWYDRYRLVRVVTDAVMADVNRAERRAVQETLFGAEAKTVSDGAAYQIAPSDYSPANRDLTHSWARHFDGKGPAIGMNGNEKVVAMAIDGHPKVKTWLRNLSRDPAAFWIPRSPGVNGQRRFYPDFVVWLASGKVLVVEHKGGLEQAEDVADKQHAGDWWAAKTGQGFVMTHDDAKGNVDLTELRGKLNA